MKYKMITKTKSDFATSEFHGFLIEADSLDEAYEKMHLLKGVNGPAAGNYHLVEYVDTRGRPKFEKSTKRTILVSDDDYDKIPEKKAKFIREAIKEKLRREKFATDIDLRNKYKFETGLNWFNSDGEPDIDYVYWLENLITGAE